MALNAEVRIDLAAARREVTALIRQLQGAFDFGDVDLGLDDAALQLRSAEQEAGRLDRQLDQIEGRDLTLQAEIDTEGVEEQADGIGELIKGRLAGAGIGAFVASAIGDALERENLEARLAASLGLTGGDATRIGAIAGDLYAEGFVGSIDEAFGATGAAAQALRGFGETGADAIGEAASAAVGLQEVFGVGITESIRAAGQLVRNGLAPDFEEAFDLITVGFQNGLDRGGDFLDTLNEYGSTFDRLGIDGPRALDLLSGGLQAGAFNADLAADAIREFGIRVAEDSDRAADAIDRLGLDSDGLLAAFAEGGPAASEAFDQVTAAIAEVQDPLEQTQIAVELFGTKVEDVGTQLATSFAPQAESAFSDTSGAIENLNEQLETTDTRLQELRRDVEGIANETANDVLSVVNPESSEGFVDGLNNIVTDGLIPFADRLPGVNAGLRRFSDALGVTEPPAIVLRDSLVDLTERAETARGTFERGFAGRRELEELAAAAAEAETQFAALEFGVGGAANSFLAAEAAAGALERRIADAEFGTIDFQLILDQQSAAEFEAAVALFAPRVAALFGSPFTPALTDEDIAAYLDRVIELQTAASQLSFNLIRLEDELDDEEFATLVELVDAAGEEAGPLFVQQLVDAVGTAQFDTLRSKLEQVTASAELGPIVAQKIAEAQVSDVPVDLDVNDEQLRLIGEQLFGVDVVANLDDSDLVDRLSETYNVNAVLDVTVPPIPTLALTGEVTIDGITFPPGGLPPLPLAGGGAFDLAGVRRFDRGGHVGWNPGAGIPFVLPDGSPAVFGESSQGPEVLEYGPAGLAVVGAYHDDQLTDRRLQAAGIDATRFPRMQALLRSVQAPTNVTVDMSAVAAENAQLRAQMEQMNSRMDRLIAVNEGTEYNTKRPTGRRSLRREASTTGVW